MTNENDAVDNVNTKEDFIKFTQDLSRNFDEDPDSWENITVSSYLEAMSAYVEYMSPEVLFENFGIVIPENPDWKFFARVLLAGKEYE